MTVYSFPQEWYKFAQATYRLQAMSLVSPRTFINGKNVKGPIATAWIGQFTLATQQDPVRQSLAAFFSRLDGQAGLLRISDPSRRAPWYNRNNAGSDIGWSDGSTFNDGSLWGNGLLPAMCYVDAAANKGDNFFVLGGLPASLTDAFMRGDLVEIMPDGIAGSCPNLYEIMVGGDTDSSGRIGLEVRPRLRASFAVGDQASLSYPSTVFRLTDDDQGVLQVTPPVLGSGGFNLIEAIDQIP